MINKTEDVGLAFLKNIIIVVAVVVMSVYIYTLCTQKTEGKIYKGTDYDDFFDGG